MTILARMHEDAKDIFQAGLQAVAPADAIHRYCRRQDELLLVGDRTYDLSAIEQTIVVGAGKATAAMAQAMEKILGDHLSRGIISVKYGHGSHLKKIRTIEAGHPIPDTQGQNASRQILELARQAGKNDLVIVLISGGGSALLPLPIQGISLEEKQMTSDLLIGCGATIHEINAIRKHISGIKGGHLAQTARPAQVVTLILSDVVGDDLDVIASGPTVPDGSTFDQCWEIVERYAIADQLPNAVTGHLQNGTHGKTTETPKSSSHQWNHVHNQIVGSNMNAVEAAQKKAKELGYHTLILTSRLEGETRIAAKIHGAIAREILATGHPLAPPVCILSGGETTVTIKGEGLGGRNQEFALAAALDIDGTEHIAVLSGGTDGTDGFTDAAGAIADNTTVERALQAGLPPRKHLDNNDSNPFFKQLNDLLITGPTQTNVMDMHIVLVKENI